MSTSREEFRAQVIAQHDQKAEYVLDVWMSNPDLKRKVDSLIAFLMITGEKDLTRFLCIAAARLSLMADSKQQAEKGES